MNFLKKAGRILMMLCMVAMLTTQITVQAKEIVNPEMARTTRMESIASYGVDLSISSSGKASVNAYVNGKSGVSYTCISVTLQKKMSSGWKEVETWVTSNDGRSVAIAEVYQVSKGTYRVVASFVANSESKSMTTANKIY